MKFSVRYRILIIVGLLLTLLLSAGSASAQKDSRSLQWDRWDVAISNIVTSSNSFDVTETHVLSIFRGPFSFGFREIPQDKLQSIDNVTLTDNSRTLQQKCSNSAGTFCLSTTSDNYFRITYYFATSANNGDKHTIVMKYTVHGALRSYADGDELAWKALADDRPYSVADSTVSVQIPSGMKLIDFGSDPKTWKQSRGDNSITWKAPGFLGTTSNVEIGLKYPHDASMPAPSWQAYEFGTKPLINLGLLVLTGLIAILGALGMFIYYSRHGRDPAVVVVPEYLTEPPSDELPGVVGTLVDEKADMQDILATLIDLARRGYIVIEQTQESHLGGLLKDTEFAFHLRTDNPGTDLRPYERSLISGIFPGNKQETTLTSLKNRFYTSIPKIKSGLYNELVKGGYFTRSPEATRNTWAGAGIALIILAGLAVYGLYQIKNGLWLFMPGIGIGTTGLVMIMFASYMPAKTSKGAQDSAKWRAFRNYLKNIKKYTDVAQAGDQFEKYIGYATAFGLNQQWTNEFVGTLTTFPTWYYPTYLGGPWHGGYGYYRQHGGFAQGGMGSMGQGMGLNDFNKSLTQGLNSMSTGLTTMLNQASSAMTSKPSSSGSSFGGGGGFHGGGSSGGGHAGFG